MAAAQNIGETSDNPVGINITAMVDIIFCLCLFFMCSLKFKQLEGKIEAWLPKDHGVNPRVAPLIVDEIRIRAICDRAKGVTRRSIGARPVADDGEMMRIVMEMAGDFHRLRRQFLLLVDANPDVPWQDVLHIADLCKRDGLPPVEFAQPFAAR